MIDFILYIESIIERNWDKIESIVIHSSYKIVTIIGQIWGNYNKIIFSLIIGIILLFLRFLIFKDFSFS